MLEKDILYLVKPTIEFKDKALDFKQEHFNNEERIINGSCLLDQIDVYEEWLGQVSRNATIDTVSPDWVLSDVFFVIRKSDEQMVGIIDLRYELNEFLKDFGACGYSIRPTERRKGYASESLKQVCKIAKQAGMKKLQLSAKRENMPSIKVIINNGGVYIRTFIYENKECDVYTIDL